MGRSSWTPSLSMASGVSYTANNSQACGAAEVVRELNLDHVSSAGGDAMLVIITEVGIWTQDFALARYCVAPCAESGTWEYTPKICGSQC